VKIKRYATGAQIELGDSVRFLMRGAKRVGIIVDINTVKVDVRWLPPRKAAYKVTKVRLDDLNFIGRGYGAHERPARAEEDEEGGSLGGAGAGSSSKQPLPAVNIFAVGDRVRITDARTKKFIGQEGKVLTLCQTYAVVHVWEFGEQPLVPYEDLEIVNGRNVGTTVAAKVSDAEKISLRGVDKRDQKSRDRSDKEPIRFAGHR
jgi:hypothetical protein